MTLTSRFGLAAVVSVTLFAVLRAIDAAGFYIQMIGQGQLAGMVFLLWALGVVGCVAACLLTLANAQRARPRAAMVFGAANIILGVLVVWVTLA